MDGADELAELTPGLRDGRAEAWERLYAAVHLPLLRLLRRLVRDDARAEEALQAVFVTAIERFPAFDPALGTVDAWLVGIAKKKALEAGRPARATAARAGGPGDLESIPDGAASNEGDGSDAELVAQALDALEPRYAEVLRRKYVDGESLEAIAAALGLKVATVGTMLHRGRERFREAFARLAAAELRNEK